MKAYLPASMLLARARWEQVSAGRHYNDDWHNGQQPRSEIADLAHRLGCDRQTVDRWRKAGRIELYKADKIACRLGLHPHSVWGDIWWEACELADLELDLSVVKVLRRDALTESWRLREAVEAA